MYRIEGIAHFNIEQLYTFDYLKGEAELYNPSVDSLVTKWYTTISDYNNVLQEQLSVSQAKI